MKHLILSIFILCSISLLGQNEVAKIVIGIANKKDTFSIKHFNAFDNLLFEKFFPVGHQPASIFTCSYDDSNRKTREIFLNMYGDFEVIDYEYDSLHTIRKLFAYSEISHFWDSLNIYDVKSITSYLKRIITKIHNVKDLEETTIFKEKKKEGGFLSEIGYYKDTLLVKLIKFRWKGDTSEIINYSYNDQNLLILESIQHNTIASFFQPSRTEHRKRVYTYDTLGRMLSEEFYYYIHGKKPYELTKYCYDTPNIVKTTFEIQGKTLYIGTKEYKNDKIVKWTYYKEKNKKWEIEDFTMYEYDEQNRLIKEFHSAYNKGRPLRIKYIYITK